MNPLMQSLLAATDESDSFDSCEVDLSVPFADGRMLEISDRDGETVNVGLTRSELQRLHAMITKVLLS